MKIWLDNVQCNGSEQYLHDCRFNSWGVTSQRCVRHINDVGVVCYASDFEVQIRLANGTTPSEGRVEINYNGRWGTICDHQWTSTDAAVVCRQLGYEGERRCVHVRIDISGGTRRMFCTI